MRRYAKVSIEEIVPYKDNAKVHPQRQIDQLRASIVRAGSCTSSQGDWWIAVTKREFGR